MDDPKNNSNSIDEYIARFPPEVQRILKELRAVIQAAAPEAQEKISYQIPTFYLKGNLIHFAAYPNHIGLYPAPHDDQPFAEELSAYKTGKGTLRFPIDEPLPLALISEYVKFRVVENLNRAAAKSRKRIQGDLPAALAQPARRALAGAGIQNLRQLSGFSSAEIGRLHGIGRNALAQLRQALAEKGLAFADEL